MNNCSEFGNIEKYEATIEELEAKIRYLEKRKYAPDPAMDVIERLCNKRDDLQSKIEQKERSIEAWKVAAKLYKSRYWSALRANAHLQDELSKHG